MDVDTPAAKPAGALRSRLVVSGEQLRRPWVLVELLGLSWLAVAQPVLTVYEHAPDVIVTHRASWSDIALLAALLTVVPPLVLGLPALLARTDARRRLLLVLASAIPVGLAGAGMAHEVAPRNDLLAATTPILAGAAYVLLRLSSQSVRQAVRLLALAPVAYLAYFVLASPVAHAVDAGHVADAESSIGNPVPVVLVVMDELPTLSLLDPDGAIDAGTFPAFAELAEDATWYRNHATVAPFTSSAVPALLSGTVRGESTPPTTKYYPQTIFSLLEGTYDFDVTETHITNLCVSDSCGSQLQGSTAGTLGGLLDEAASVWWAKVGPGRTAAPVDFAGEGDTATSGPTSDIRGMAARLGFGEKPRLYFLHLLLPHQPWSRLPGGKTYDTTNPPPGMTFLIWDDEASAERARVQHLLQLRRTDQLLGELLDRLHESGVYEEALVIVTADHGASFQAHEPSRGTSAATAHDVLLTPLLVKLPGQTQGARVDDPVWIVDVLPTIADVLGLELPEPVAGASLLDLAHAPVDRAHVVPWAYDGTGLEVRDGEVLVDRDALFAELLDAAAAQPRRDPSDPDALYRIGPHPELIGAPVGDARVVDAVGGALRLSKPSAGALEVDPEVRQLPAFVHGRLSSIPSGPVAVVANGVVAFVAEPRPLVNGEAELWGLVPQRLLHEGSNELTAYIVQRADPLTLAPVSLRFED